MDRRILVAPSRPSRITSSVGLKSVLTAADVEAFRFSGTVATDRWPTITGGTYLVSDAVDERADVFGWSVGVGADHGP